MVAAAGYQDWYVGLALSFVVVVVVVIIVATILALAARIADRAGNATTGVDVVRAQTTSLDGGVDRVNDSAVRILHMARVLRKVAVGNEDPPQWLTRTPSGRSCSAWAAWCSPW